MESGVIVGSEYKEDGLHLQVDGYGEDNAGVEPAVYSHPAGFMSRPLDPELDPEGLPLPLKSCQAIYYWEGGRCHVIPTADPRAVVNLPRLGKGDACMFSADGVAFVRINNTTHEITMMTSADGTKDGPSIWLSLGPDGLFIVTPWGRFEFSPNGFHVTHASGGRLDIGGIGLPGPLEAVSSYATLQASVVKIAGAQTLLGANASGTYLPAGHGLPSDQVPVAVPWVTMLSGSVKIAALG